MLILCIGMGDRVCNTSPNTAPVVAYSVPVNVLFAPSVLLVVDAPPYAATTFVVAPKNIFITPVTSQSPAVREMLVTVFAVNVVSETADPLARVADTYSPTLPAEAFDASVTPVMFGVFMVGDACMTNVEPVPVCAATEVAFPTLVIGPVRFAFVVTFPAVRPEAVPDKVPPNVKLPLLVTVPVKVMPLTVPVPVTLVTVPPEPVADSVPATKDTPVPIVTLLNPPAALPYRIEEPLVAGA